jgi:hypothetical protein
MTQSDGASQRTHTLVVGQTVTIRKLSSAGKLVFAYEGVIAQALPHGVRLDAMWTRDEMELGYTTFAPGDHFIEWFYADRWYNIMEVRGAGDTLKGWYCNITHPAEFQDDHITYRDLALDLWVAPDGAMTTLDEDEFDADEAIDAHARRQALTALERLRGLVAQRLAPFDLLPL